ncbi:MAG: hypothetical protein AVDCRST_MAG75-2226, partial [uncultured Propionibacteriaceae bacterium]
LRGGRPDLRARDPLNRDHDARRRAVQQQTSLRTPRAGYYQRDGAPM